MNFSLMCETNLNLQHRTELRTEDDFFTSLELRNTKQHRNLNVKILLRFSVKPTEFESVEIPTELPVESSIFHLCKFILSFLSFLVLLTLTELQIVCNLSPLSNDKPACGATSRASNITLLISPLFAIRNKFPHCNFCIYNIILAHLIP